MSDLAAKVAEISDPTELAPIIVAALQNMGSKGKTASDALIREMRRRGDEFEETALNDVQEALCWLIEDVSDALGFSV